MATEALTYIIQRFLITLLKADKYTRAEAGLETRGKQAKAVQIAMPVHTARADFTEGLTLQLLDIPAGWQEDEAELCAFWAATKWLPGNATEDSGTNWIEI